MERQTIMEMREFIKQNFSELQDICMDRGSFSIGYDDIEDCINNDEELSNWAESEGVDV